MRGSLPPSPLKGELIKIWTMFTLLSIFEVIILIAGLALTLVNFFPGILGDKTKLKKAALIFSFTILIVTLLVVLDFIVACS